jgi:hypothetical protein
VYGPNDPRWVSPDEEWAIYSGDGDPLATELPSRESAEGSLRIAQGYGEADQGAYVDRWFG